MYKPEFRLRGFGELSISKRDAVLGHLLEALTMANVAYLLEHPETPMLYESGVRYVAEPEGEDEWQDIPETLHRGHGDCEDLACWRVAELRVRFGLRGKVRRGIALSHPKDSQGRPMSLYHIVVLYPDGTIEDPSLRLGMR